MKLCGREACLSRSNCRRSIYAGDVVLAVLAPDLGGYDIRLGYCPSYWPRDEDIDDDGQVLIPIRV